MRKLRTVLDERSVTDVARTLDLQPATVLALASGRVNPRLSTLLACRALGIELADWIEGE